MASLRAPLLGLLAAFAVAPATPCRGAMLGVFEGSGIAAVERVRRLEAWSGERHTAVMIYTSWDGRAAVLDELFGRRLPEIWASGHVPLVTWEPRGRWRASHRVEGRIARGRHDRYVREWAARMRGWLAGPDGVYGTGDDRRAWLRFAPEMNGDWTAWGAASGDDDPAEFVAMWRKVRAIFADQGIDPTRLAWIWSVNASDHGGHRAEEFWPGDDAVEWIGLSGFNWGESRPWSRWLGPVAIFDPMLARVRALSSKPVAVVETASTTESAGGHDVIAKSVWILDLYRWAAGRGIRLVVWFDDDKETDWAVFGGRRGSGRVRVGGARTHVFEAYRVAVSDPSWTAPDAASARLLSDDAFLGRDPAD